MGLTDLSLVGGDSAWDGWPLVLDLLARQEMGLLLLGGRRISAAEVLHSFLASDEQRKLAALISVLPEVSIRLLAEALGLNTADMPTALRPLIESGLVVRTLPSGQARYSVVPFMRDHLANTVNSYWAGDRLSYLRIAHARDVSTSNPLDALELLIELEYYRSAEDLLVAGLDELIVQWPKMLAILRKVPATVWSQYPIISGLLLLLEVAGHDLAEVEVQYLAKAVLEGAKRRLADGTTDYPLLVQAFLILARRRLGEGEKAWAQSVDLWQRISEAEAFGATDLDNLKILSNLITAQTALIIGENQAARTVFAQILEQMQSNHLSVQKLVALAGSAFVAAQDLQLMEAEQFLEAYREQVSNLADPQVVPWTVTVTHELAKAALASKSGTLSRERTALADVISRDHGGEYWAFYALVEAERVRQEEGPFQALRRLQARVSSGATRGGVASALVMDQIRSTMADLAVFCGRYERAEDFLATEGPLSPRRANSAARLALFRGDPAKAHRMLQQAPVREDDVQARNDRILLCAVSAYLSGAEEDAVHCFHRFAEVTVQAGIPADFSRIPYGPVRALAELAKDRGVVDLTQEVESVPPISRVDAVDELSSSQEWILAYLLQGMSNLEIAEALPRSENTVKSHLQTIYRKLGTETRQQAIVKATRLGLLEPNADVRTWEGLMSGRGKG